MAAAGRTREKSIFCDTNETMLIAGPLSAKLVTQHLIGGEWMASNQIITAGCL